MIGRSALLFSRYHSFMLLGKLLLHIRLYPGNPLLNSGIRHGLCNHIRHAFVER